jgi:hypothetical protein
MVLAAFGTGQVFWSMLYFFLFFLWIWLVIMIFTDIFRSPDLTGWGKAMWSLFVIVLPYLGVFVYLIARGNEMSEHAMDQANARDEMMRSYYGGARNGAEPMPTEVDQLVRLASLREQGVIDDEEFRRMKARMTAA